MNEFKDEQICLSEIEKNIQFQCSHCNKIITNKECMLRHKMLSKTMCKIIKFCNQCKTNYSHKSIHICGENFCKKCFTVHKKQLFCAVSSKKKFKVMYLFVI